MSLNVRLDQRERGGVHCAREIARSPNYNWGRFGFMREIRIARAGFVPSLAVALALCTGSATLVSAQDKARSEPPPSTRELPIKHASGTKLTEQQIRGAGVFTQRCALCHLPQTLGADGDKFC